MATLTWGTGRDMGSAMEVERTTLSEWDRSVAPVLHNIVFFSQSCQERARWISAEVSRLPLRPQWPTRAMAEIGQARDALVDALRVLARAEQAYSAIEKVEP